MRHAGLEHLSRYAGRYRTPRPRPADVFWADFRVRALDEAPLVPASLPARFPLSTWAGALAAALIVAVVFGARIWLAVRGQAGHGSALSVGRAEMPVFVWRDEISRAMIIWVDDTSDGYAPPGG